MINLSVNVNKVATLRNSRGGSVPGVLDAVAVCVAAGVQGITVHPRADRRHITPDDVRAIAGALEGRRPGIEYNIEGDARPELIALVQEVRPEQCTLVPVAPGEITSQAGELARLVEIAPAGRRKKSLLGAARSDARVFREPGAGPDA